MLRPASITGKASWGCKTSACKGGSLSSASLEVHHGLDFSRFRMDRGMADPDTDSGAGAAAQLDRNGRPALSCQIKQDSRNG